MKTFQSDISNSEFPISEMVSAKTIRRPILNLIQKDQPNFTSESVLSIGELNQYRNKYVEGLLSKQIGDLTEKEMTVLGSMKDKKTLTDKLDVEDAEPITLGQRIADNVASFGGSWTFIISFGIFLFFWITLNIFWLANKGFDPYPFILLNLILSCLAALQAPVIMMSQNRQEEKDRERAKKDYMVNLKSELEIRMIDEKIDHLIIKQQQDIFEMHQVQIEIMEEILRKINKIEN